MREYPDVYLFRHGLAQNNVESHIIYGRGDGVPLVEHGYKQAKFLGQTLHSKGLIPDVVCTSPAVRARQTAETTLSAMGLQIDVVEDGRLHEQHTGDWTGRIAKEVFTPEVLGAIEASGKEFCSPNGESMNDVGERMFDWLKSLSKSDIGDAQSVFGFTHGGSIRSLVSYLHDWDHAKTYQTQPDNTSLTILKNVNGLWQLDRLGVSVEELETSLVTASEINMRLASNQIVEKHLESVIWFGSERNNRDVHARSDCDLQIVLDEPVYELTTELNEILKDYPSVDLSVMYLKDIYDHKGNVIFHDGTKGPFFMYVLAAGKVLYGRNVYAEITKKMTLEDAKPSINTTIREYLSRLRVMAAQSPDDTLQFKKYSLKLFKDLLVYDGIVPLQDISRIDNTKSYKAMLAKRRFSSRSQEALNKIIDYDHTFTQADMAALLQEYEEIVEEMCNE